MKCAKKHLYGCRNLLSSYKEDGENDGHVWLELYYLSGYILEGIVVYYAYRNNGWLPQVDIQRNYNVDFTEKTHLDFYYQRKEKKEEKWAKAVKDFFANPEKRGRLSVQGHRFQEIAKSLLYKDPLFEEVPYIGSGRVIDKEINRLIESWRPEVRYKYKETNNLNGKVIAGLINACDDIYQKVRIE